MIIVQNINKKSHVDLEEYFEHFLGHSFGGYQNTMSNVQKQIASRGGFNELDRKEIDGLSEMDYVKDNFDN